MKQVRGIWLPDSDEHIAAEIARPVNPLVGGLGTYQLNKYQAALEHVGMRGHAVDVGAHVGLWSRVMARDFKRVTAIEPLAMHRACFRRNVAGIEPVPAALGAQRGNLMIDAPPAHTANAHVADHGELVEMTTLDDLAWDETPWPVVDLLKIDVEGFEYEVLTGGEWLITVQKPVIVIEQKPGNAERYGRGQWDAVELLRSWGMRDAAVIGGDHVMVW